MKKYIVLIFSLLSIIVGCSETVAEISEDSIIVENPDPVEPVDNSNVSGKNILFIVADDLTKTLSSYGHPVVKTPNIDRLAAMGVQFNNAYSNYSVCNPSRSSFLTGMKPETTTIMDNHVHLQDIIQDWVTLPALYKKNGFYTMSLGKIFHTSKEEDNDLKAWNEIYSFRNTDLGNTGEGRNMSSDSRWQDWLRWLSANGTDENQMDGQIAKKAVEFIKTNREGPFFLAVGFQKPHDPYIAPKKYFDMYPLSICDPPTIPDNWTAPPYAISTASKKTFGHFTDQDRREFLRSYYACSSFLDAQVGKLLDALEETGKLDNTVIVFLGDHGYHLGEQDHWNKVTLYEKGTSAPFIIANADNQPKGLKSNSMFEFIDIYPTMAELSRLNDVPGNLEGKSFASVIQNPTLPFREEVRAILRRGSVIGKSVKNHEWRYVEWGNIAKGVELYNQIEDPLEYNNLAFDSNFAYVVAQMKSSLNY